MQSHDAEMLAEGPMLFCLSDLKTPFALRIGNKYLQVNQAEINQPGGQNIFRLDQASLMDDKSRFYALCALRAAQMKLIAGLIVAEEADDSRLIKGAITVPEYRGFGYMRCLVECICKLEEAKRYRAIVRIMPNNQPNMASLAAFQGAGFRISHELKINLRFDDADRHLAKTAEGNDGSTIRALELVKTQARPRPSLGPEMSA